MFAIFGLIANQYTYLKAIHYTNASTATVLQYVGPVLILVYTTIKERRLPTVAEVLAISFASAGTFIIATHGQLTNLAITPRGLIWGLLSAVTYFIYVILPVKQIKAWGSLMVTGLGMLMGGLVFPITTKAWTYPLNLTPSSLLALFGLIFVGTIFSYTFFLKGTSLIGPVKASLLATVEPISAVFFSVLIMHDIFYPMDFLGMFFIISAVLLISLRDLIFLKKEKVKS